jgi:UDP-N-acetylglucosamine--N-acetylmuramyl-(pentapeptide) pyrophosphoryl-undecaprenol N-acetylglucosamine transferase
MEPENSRNRNNIIFAAGGTGGHLFPAVAIADAIMEISPESRCLFITGGKQLERNILESAGYEMETITVSGIAGLGIFTKIKAAFKIPAAVYRSASIIKAFDADAVIGMGSYTAGPVLMAAKMLGIKTGIHEQNRRPGITNRVMSKYAGRIYSSFDDTFPGFLYLEAVRVQGVSIWL